MADYRDRYEAACIVIDEAREENEKLRTDNQELLEVLEAVEWGRDGFYDFLYCPCCGNARSQGHTRDCKLGNALKKARGER